MSIFDNKILERTWKSRVSQQEGYYKNYYIDSLYGDHIELDFNFPRQMVRISLKPHDEPGREYIVVIKSGTILQEREALRRKSMDLHSRFSKHAKLFSFLRDESILTVISGTYGIPQKSVFSEPRIKIPGIKHHKDKGRFNLFRKIRKHLEKKNFQESTPRSILETIQRRLPDELFDFSMGGILIFLHYTGKLSNAELATLAGFLGLTMGAVDWVWRQRSPFLPKVIFMLIISAVAVHTEVQYRMWGMFI